MTKNSVPSENKGSEERTRPLPVYPLLLSLASVLLTVVFGLIRGDSPAIEVGFILSASVLISLVIWQACDPFADAAQWIGKRFRVPPSVRGATLDAIASSMPELFTGLFFVTIALTSDKSDLEILRASAEGYGSTIATCAGSSIYNMILIPAICAIAISRSRSSKPVIEVAPDVLKRDGGWVLASQFGLLVFLFQPKLSWWMGLIALLAYLVYVGQLVFATRKFRATKASVDALGELDEDAEFLFGWFSIRLTTVSALMILAISTATAALACYYLVALTQVSARSLGVPAFFIAVILTAAVSSIPDTFMSLGAARRGDDSGAISNVFGSNIFDICIGMSIPLLVSCYLNDWQPIELINEQDQTMRGVVGLRVFLFLITVVAMGVMWRKREISARTGWFFVGLYASFLLYAVLGATGVVSV